MIKALRARQRPDGVLRVHDGLRAQADRPHADAPRPQPRRPDGPPAADRRPRQADPQAARDPRRRAPARSTCSAPFISMFAALVVVRADAVRRRGDDPGHRHPRSTSRSPTPTSALLYVAAIGSMGFYGMLIGGWASGSKYALLGGLRAVAQLVSYEVAFTLAIIGVVIQSGTLSLQGIVNAQSDYPVHRPADPRLRDLLPRRAGRVQPPAVRPRRGRRRDRRRLPHRVRRHALRDVRERRVRRGDRALGARRDALPGRLARPAAVRAVHVDPRPAAG